MKSLTKIMITFGLGIAVSICLAIFVFSPALADINNINNTIKEKKKEVVLLDQQIRAFNGAKIDLAKATRKNEVSEAILIKEDLSVVIKELEAAATKTATRHSLDIKELAKDSKSAPTPVINSTAVDQVHFDLTTINDYAGTINFLSYLEHLPHFSEIGNLSLTADVGTGDSGASIRTGQIDGSFHGVFLIKKP